MEKIIEGFSSYIITDEGICKWKDSGKLVKIRIHHRSPEVSIKNDKGKFN